MNEHPDPVSIEETDGDAVQASAAGPVDPDEVLARPASEPAPASRRSLLSDGGSRRFMIFAGMVVVALGLALWYAYAQRGQVMESVVTRAPQHDPTPGGERQAESPRYQETLEQANRAMAEEAQRSGETFIPTIETVPMAVDQLDEGDAAAGVDRRQAVAREEAIPPSPILARVSMPAAARQETPAPQQAARRDGREKNPFVEAMQSQAGMIMRSWQPKGAAAQIFRREGAEPGVAAASGGSNPAPANAQRGEVELLVPAGGIVYAEMINSVNSDVQSPVLVRITTGPLKGARMMGGFSAVQGADGLAVAFNTIVLEDGRSTSVRAFAIDGITAESLIASSVDRRLLARYGPALAAGFITGAAEALAAGGQEIVVGDGSTIVTQPKKTFAEAAAAGIAQAGGMIASDIAGNAPRGPLIRLEAGHPLAVLFMQELMVQKDGEAPAPDEDGRTAANGNASARSADLEELRSRLASISAREPGATDGALVGAAEPSSPGLIVPPPREPVVPGMTVNSQGNAMVPPVVQQEIPRAGAVEF